MNLCNKYKMFTIVFYNSVGLDYVIKSVNNESIFRTIENIDIIYFSVKIKTIIIT